MLNSMEVGFINKIQNLFFTDGYDHAFIRVLDHTAKFITSRKYRVYVLIVYMLFMIFCDEKLSYLDILFQVPKFYIFAFLSRLINIQIKLYFKRNRPYVKHKSIKVLEKAREKKKNTYSFPSNSIQTSLIFYGFMLKTMCFSKIVNIIILTTIVLIISFTKINRGMHYPSDILFSIILYYLLLTIYNYFLFLMSDYTNLIQIYYNIYNYWN